MDLMEDRMRNAHEAVARMTRELKADPRALARAEVALARERTEVAAMPDAQREACRETTRRMLYELTGRDGTR